MWNIIQEVNYVELRDQGFQFNLSIDKIHFGITIAIIARTCMAPPVPYVEDRSSSQYIYATCLSSKLTNFFGKDD